MNLFSKRKWKLHARACPRIEPGPAGGMECLDWFDYLLTTPSASSVGWNSSELATIRDSVAQCRQALEGEAPEPLRELLATCLSDVKFMLLLHKGIHECDGTLGDPYLRDFPIWRLMELTQQHVEHGPSDRMTRWEGIRRYIGFLTSSLLPALLWEYLSRTHSSLLPSSGLCKILLAICLTSPVASTKGPSSRSATAGRRTSQTTDNNNNNSVIRIPLAITSQWTCDAFPCPASKRLSGNPSVVNATMINAAVLDDRVQELRADECKKIKNDVYLKAATQAMKFSSPLHELGTTLMRCAELTEKNAVSAGCADVLQEGIPSQFEPWFVTQCLRAVREKTLPLLGLLSESRGLYLCFQTLLGLLRALADCEFSCFEKVLSAQEQQQQPCSKTPYRFPVDEELMLEMIGILAPCLTGAPHLETPPPSVFGTLPASSFRTVDSPSAVVELCKRRSEAEILIRPMLSLLSLQTLTAYTASSSSSS